MSCMLANERGEYVGQTSDGFRVRVSEHAFFSELEALAKQGLPYEEASRRVLDPGFWKEQPRKCLDLRQIDTPEWKQGPPPFPPDFSILEIPDEARDKILQHLVPQEQIVPFLISLVHNEWDIECGADLVLRETGLLLRRRWVTHGFDRLWRFSLPDWLQQYLLQGFQKEG